jgi:hypothetical protein
MCGQASSMFLMAACSSPRPSSQKRPHTIVKALLCGRVQCVLAADFPERGWPLHFLYPATNAPSYPRGPSGPSGFNELSAANTLRMNVDEAGHRSENCAVAAMAAGASDREIAS